MASGWVIAENLEDKMNFTEFQKIPRLSRECIITEKIDGTNGSIFIEPVVNFLPVKIVPALPGGVALFESDDAKIEYWLKAHSAFYRVRGPNGLDMIMAAGQRTQWTDPKGGNAGFGKWVYDNREELVKLGPGHHFGEWWGGKIQRGYGLKEKRFSLFNTSRWNDETKPTCCHVVPVLYQGLFTTTAVDEAIERLQREGSLAAPGFMNPEGVVVYHVAGNLMFKKTIEKDEMPKGQLAREAQTV